ncbi:hypothetical protein BC834DRAFT_841589 [Gloeopeniophorella convolvens]|nr:hypothetical protein BC834DRAFT_841589 [Gloeopeniophorella convolvens]
MNSDKLQRPVDKRPPALTLFTPSASPPGSRHVSRPPNRPPEHPSPSKRARLAGTPSSSSSLTNARDPNSVDFQQARFENTMRLKDAWERLAQRYARPLDEDDIIDLRSEKILKDRGVVRRIGSQINFGDISLPEEPNNDASSEGGGAQTEGEEELDEIDVLSHGATVPQELEAQLRRIKPLRDQNPEDEDDLKEFLEAEKRTREEFGPLDEDYGEDVVQWQGELASDSGDSIEEVEEEGFAASSPINGDHSDPGPFRRRASRPTTPRTKPPSMMSRPRAPIRADADSDDELGGWDLDESNALYEVAKPSISAANHEREVIEIFDTPPSSPTSELISLPPRLQCQLARHRLE